MSKSVIVGCAVWAALAGTAAAAPGELPDTAHEEDAPPLTVLEATAAQPCAVKQGMCIVAGGRSTLAMASAPVAAATATTSGAGKLAPVVPRFSRAASVASSDGAPTASDKAPWTLELDANLKRPAWTGNALFLFFDMEDAEALENRQFTALYQAPIKAGPKVAARVVLAPEDGFRAGHTYRVRIVQLINGKEIVLTEGDVSLL